MRRALLSCLAVLLAPSDALAFEGLWHAGVDAGYALGGFPGGGVNGFGGGLHLTYGITDAINLRAQGDVTAFDLREPGASALVYGGAAGAEYVLDVVDWVLYTGALAGPVDVSIEGGESSGDLWQLGVAVPVGLEWMFSPRWGIGVEGQYRIYLFGPEGSPTSNLTFFGRFEAIWGHPAEWRD